MQIMSTSEGARTVHICLDLRMVACGEGAWKGKLASGGCDRIAGAWGNLITADSAASQPQWGPVSHPDPLQASGRQTLWGA